MQDSKKVTLRRTALTAFVVASLGGASSMACSADGDKKILSRQELLDPETCKECHADHYREWSGSMHAYAADDPVFLAMNRRGQEETNGALGDFCINCHAPMAVREGAPTDGLNIDEVPRELKGITCYFCHNVESIDGQHNNPLVLANDQTMRGGIRNPVEGAAHDSAYSALHDSQTVESSRLCGTCHDITVPSPPGPAEVELERTFKEWQGSVFGPEIAPDSVVPCGSSCHMTPSERPVAEVDGVDVPIRFAHGHEFAAVDVALTPFPEMDRQRQLIQEALDTTLRVDVCVETLPNGSAIRVVLDNVGPGHRWPSGASQDRRAFVEVRAFEGPEVVYESGVLADDRQALDLDEPDLWLLRDRLIGKNGEEVHMFWEVASVIEETIPAPITADRSNPDFFVTHVRRDFPNSGIIADAFVDRVTVRVRIRPMGFDVLDDLVASGHLDAAVKDEMPIFDLVPNRHIPSVESVTFEWSEETRNDPRFQTFFDTTVPGRRFDCIGMRTNAR